jgi:hypothetical protein
VLEGVVHIENYGFVWRFNKNIDYFSASNSLINVSIDRFNRDILQTEIFYITELLAEVNQELLGHVHSDAKFERPETGRLPEVVPRG